MVEKYNGLDQKTKGIIMIIIASLGFAFMSIFVKLSGDLPSIEKVFFRNLVSVFVMFVLITRKKGSYFGKRENRTLLLLRSTFGTIGMVFYFFSIQNLVASDANALNKLSTFFLILFSFIFLSEKVKLKQVLAIMIAFVGALFIIKPSFDIEIGYLTSILSAMTAGAAYTVLRALGKREEVYTVVFFFSIFSVVVLFPFMMYGFEPISGIQLLYLALTGISATVGQLGTTLAYKYAPASEISIFNFSNVIFVTLLSIPILSEIPDFFSIIGYVIIFSASYYIYKMNLVSNHIGKNKI
jgi:drug/metabolite transporter (DMT)-like permease